MDVNWIYCVDYFAIHTNIESLCCIPETGASQAALVVKNPLANAGDTRGASSTPGSGRSPGVGNGNPLQNPSLENSMDRGAWQPAVHGVGKSWT